MKIMVINGPNINLIGLREPNIYGKKDYAYLEKIIEKKAKDNNITIDISQNNIEGEIVNYIHMAYEEKYDGIIINAGAYTHTSIAILDALNAVSIPAVEVHISNIYKREKFRHVSFPAKACIAQISGFGLNGYLLAIDGIINYINEVK